MYVGRVYSDDGRSVRVRAPPYEEHSYRGATASSGRGAGREAQRRAIIQEGREISFVEIEVALFLERTQVSHNTKRLEDSHFFKSASF